MNNFLKEPTAVSVFLCGNRRGGDNTSQGGDKLIYGGDNAIQGGDKLPHVGDKTPISKAFTIWYAEMEY